MWAPGNKRDDDDDTKRFNQRLRVRRLVSISLDSLGPIAIGNKRIQSNRKGRSCCWQQKRETGRLSLLQRATGLLTSRRRKKKMIHKYRKEKTRHVFSWRGGELEEKWTDRFRPELDFNALHPPPVIARQLFFLARRRTHRMESNIFRFPSLSLSLSLSNVHSSVSGPIKRYTWHDKVDV